MSGHSKWNNIRRKKEASDAAKGAIFTKFAKEIAVAVKAGGADVNGNSRLKVVVAKAKAANMPNDNINRAIKKAAEAGEGDDYEEITYEGYGPAGVAVMAKALTNNRNRTAADIRHIFDKNGGNLGVDGSVSFLFEEKGTILISKEDYEDEDAVNVDVTLLTGGHAAHGNGLQVVVTVQTVHHTGEHEFDVACLPDPLLVDRGAPEGIAPVNEVDPGTDSRKIKRFFQSRIAPADDGHGHTAEKVAVTDGTVGNTMTQQPVLILHAEPAVRGA